MCGACGSPPGRHWSTPFLATVPARTSAARAVTAIATRTGSRVTVAASTAGYSVTSATGQCSIAADLGEVWARLRRLPGLDGVPPAPPQLPSAGPATLPPVHAADSATAAVDGPPTHAADTQLHRLPPVLAWLAGVDGRGPRQLRLRLGLTPQIDAAIDMLDGDVVRCAAVPAAHAVGDAPIEELDDPACSFGEALDVVVGAWVVGGPQRPSTPHRDQAPPPPRRRRHARGL